MDPSIANALSVVCGSMVGGTASIAVACSRKPRKVTANGRWVKSASAN